MSAPGWKWLRDFISVEVNQATRSQARNAVGQGHPAYGRRY